MKKIFISFTILLSFFAVFLTFNPLLIVLASQSLVYLFWRFIFERKKGVGLLIVIMLALVAISLSVRASFIAEKDMINTVAPYAFDDYGDFIEIKGGWNISDTKDESTVIVCDKKLGVCADFTARLVSIRSRGHLHVLPILWEIKSWRGEAVDPGTFLSKYKGAILATSADRGGIYSDSVLYVDRESESVFIIRKTSGMETDDWKELLDINDMHSLPNDWEILETLQNTFYERN